MKGIKKALCLLVLLFSVALALPVTANASTNGHTAQEALAWAKAQVGKSLDYDGVYGAQCVDLIKYYYDFWAAPAMQGVTAATMPPTPCPAVGRATREHSLSRATSWYIAATPAIPTAMWPSMKRTE